MRGWKLFMLAPRMLLYHSPGEARVPPAELDRRIEAFRAGRWSDLLQEASAAAAAAPSAQRGDPASDGARAHRAVALVHLGELSADARALTSEPLAPGNSDTLAELRDDPERRPPAPYAPLPDATLRHVPDRPCPLPLQAFDHCVRSARRGSAAGPSGGKNEHVRILLDDEEDSRLLHAAALRLAQAQVPVDILDGLRVGRLAALHKPNSRVRALVVDPSQLP